MTSVAAFIAANRFGLGPRQGELATIARDPRGWVLAQIDPSIPMHWRLRGLPPSEETVREFYEARLLKGEESAVALARTKLREITLEETEARFETAIRTDTPLRERMAAFWSNHFTVSGKKFPVIAFAGAYEREAIRPYVFGKFSDMLAAAVRHPAMLTYLDNAVSVGPRSRAAGAGKRGLNENLAREILELHTLGVNGGYTQADVTEFAKILTGWTHGGIRTKAGLKTLGPVHGRFEFLPLAHEPGAKTLLGTGYAEAGEREGQAALETLARHPATAAFVGTKLARHFIADEPPPESVRLLARRFIETEGDLGEVTRTLVSLDDVWANPLAKIKQPFELLVSALRALAVDEVTGNGMTGSLNELGQSLWQAPSPQGWPDRGQDWISPESLLRRVEWLRALAARNGRRFKPEAVLEATIGPVASAATREAVDNAPSVDDAVALILASPEFQRR